MARKRRTNRPVQAHPKEVYFDNGAQFLSPGQAVIERLLAATDVDIRKLPGYTQNPKGSSKNQSDERDT